MVGVVLFGIRCVIAQDNAGVSCKILVDYRGFEWKCSNMIGGRQLSELQEVFVNFEASKLDGCNVVYLNEELAGKESSATITNAYSYAIGAGTKSPKGQSSVKIFMAERYGGDGILTNGGGGRCGFDGIWQLKGIGPNQLVGKEVDAGHGDGNLCLGTAIYESIWSEIINVVLPFGAIRTIAILDTGRTYEERGIQTPRGLLVRQPVVRPAHFIRAIFFEETQVNELCKDAQRVKAAITKLADFLPGEGAVSTASSMSERLESGFLELAARFAEQFAAARAKHIIHYNVSASNLSLDGGWLDLSGTRLFSNLIEDFQVDIDRFNTEYFPAVESLRSLSYYLEKYSVITVEESACILDKTINCFAQRYSKQLSLYQVAQAGFPLWILRALIDSKEFECFSSSLRKFFEFEDFTVHKIRLEGGWSGYERRTARVFNELLSSRVSASVASFPWLRADAAAISQLQSSYNKFLDLASKIASEQQISLQNVYRCMLINMTRLNRSHSLLHDIDTRIERIRTSVEADKRRAYQMLSEEAVHAAQLNLGNEQKQCVPFWLSSTLSIWFDPVSGMFTLQAADICSLSIDDLVEQREQNKDVNMALGFYRGPWRCLNEKVI